MTDDLKFLKYYTLFGFFVIGIVTVLLGQVLPVLSSRLSLNDAQSGVLLSAQFAGALLGTLSVGQLIRRLGFPTASLIGLLLIAAGLPALNSHSFVICWLGIFVYGSGIGMAIPAVNLLTIEATPADRQSSAVNLLNFGWGAGAICSQPFASAMSRGNSLVLLTITLVVALFLVAICFIFVIRKSRDSADDGSTPDLPAKIWNRPVSWLFVAFAFFTIGVEGGIHGWLTTYSESVTSSSGAAGISATVVYFFFYVVGRGIASFVSRSMPENKLITLCSALMLIGVSLIVISETLLFVGSAIAGLGCSAIFPTNMVRFAKIFGPGATRKATPIFISGTAGAAAITSLVGFASFRLGNLRWGIAVILMSALFVFVLQLMMSAAFRNPNGVPGRLDR
jgi:MFS transporter, FHS family, glucose/mannose:H+ symporter